MTDRKPFTFLQGTAFFCGFVILPMTAVCEFATWMRKDQQYDRQR